MTVTVPDPAIQAGITKSLAQVGIAPATGGNNFAALIEGAANATGQASTTAPVWTIPLWRGTHKATQRRISPGGEEIFVPTTLNTTPDQYNPDDASTQFGILLTDKAKLHEWSQLAWKAGLVSADHMNDAAALNGAWNTAVGWAVNIKAATRGSTEVTPFEAAKMVAQNTGSALLAQQADAAAHFTGNKTTTSTSIDQSQSAATGDVLHQLLGRNPTAGEKAAYQHGLNRVAAENPTKTTSVNSYVNGQQTAQTNTTTGGYDQKAAAVQEASSASPEVAKNQAATTYYQALVQALGAAV